MAADTNSSSSPSLIAINVALQTPIKLTSSNYCAWRMQFRTCLIGYDLLGFIDGSHPCPPAASTSVAATAARSSWIRQDQLLLNAIVGSLSPQLVPFIASATTSHQAWNILFTMYGKPSHGRIMQLRSDLDTLSKGTKPISDYTLRSAP